MYLVIDLYLFYFFGKKYSNNPCLQNRKHFIYLLICFIVESSKEWHLFEIETFCDIIKNSYELLSLLYNVFLMKPIKHKNKIETLNINYAV